MHDKVRAYRGRSRRRSLRPPQIPAPHPRSPTFEAEAHRQSLAVAGSPQADEDQRLVDAISVPYPE